MGEAGSRERIVEAALRLFSRKGYGLTSVREVVEEAGVTKPTLYYYFDSKEALFRSVVSEKIEGLSAQIEHFAAAEGPFEDRLRSFLRTYLIDGSADTVVLRFLMTCSMYTTEGPSLDIIRRHLLHAGIFARVLQAEQAKGNLSDGMDAEQAAAALFGAANLHLMAACEGVQPTMETVEGLIKIWLRGVQCS